MGCRRFCWEKGRNIERRGGRGEPQRAYSSMYASSCEKESFWSTEVVQNAWHCERAELIRRRVSGQEYFSIIYNGEENESIGKARRLSVQKGINDLHRHGGMSNVRSLFVFDMTGFSWESWTSISTSFRLLGSVWIWKAFQDEVTGLFNLRYLGSRRTLVKKLPRSPERLRNLQTLDLYDSKIEELPQGITYGVFMIEHLLR